MRAVPDPDEPMLLASRGIFGAESLGSGLGVALVVFIAAVLTIMLLQVALSWFVLERGGQRPASRLLAAYIMLQFFAWGPFLADLRVVIGDFQFHGFVAELGAGTGLAHQMVGGATFAFLPAILVAFCLAYPSLHPAVRRRRWLLALPFALSTGLAIAAVLLFPLGAAPADGPLQPRDDSDFRVLFLGLIGYLAIAVALGAGIFRHRARNAETTLEAQRLRYMTGWILIPSLIGLGSLVVLGAIGSLTLQSEFTFILVLAFYVLLIALFAIVPPLALTYGLLRYRILDLEKRVRTGVRLTLRSSLLLCVFVLVFFIVSEGAELLVAQGTQSAALGMAAAFLVTFVLHPVQEAANRVARRAVPEDPRSAAERRAEVYRATYEDVVADGGITERERRTLESLARTLGLEPAAVATIEAAADAERAARHARLAGPAPLITAG